jgi:hypothetical protein
MNIEDKQVRSRIANEKSHLSPEEQLMIDLHMAQKNLTGDDLLDARSVLELYKQGGGDMPTPYWDRAKQLLVKGNKP